MMVGLMAVAMAASACNGDSGAQAIDGGQTTNQTSDQTTGVAAPVAGPAGTGSGSSTPGPPALSPGVVGPGSDQGSTGPVSDADRTAAPQPTAPSAATADAAATGPPVPPGATAPSTPSPGPGGGGAASTTAGTAPAGLTGEALNRYLAGRYRAYWDAYETARSAPSANPAQDFPLLGSLAAGSQLDVSYQTVIDLARTGESIHEPATPAISGTTAAAEHRLRIDSVDGAAAQLSGCVVNDDVRAVTATGAVASNTVVTVRSAATMAFTDGQWKLIRSEAVEITSGVGGCWDDPGHYPY